MSKQVIIRVVAAIVVAVFSGGAWIQSGKLDIGWLRYFSAAVFIATIALTSWDLWVWRIPVIQRIPTVPRNIRGTWKGKLDSLWIDPNTGTKRDSKLAFLVVRQTSTTVSARLLTDESQSASSLAAVTISDGAVHLEFMYLNRPKIHLEDRSRMHHGSTALQITGNPAERLEGRYWTDRDTRGSLHFNRRVSKPVDDYLAAVTAHDEDDVQKQQKAEATKREEAKKAKRQA
jgi:SMODS-associating 2TM, beta-strand rich effector domain